MTEEKVFIPSNWIQLGSLLSNHEALLVKGFINRLWMVSTNTERKIEMVLDYPGYEIRISN
jgi:hypothetical protein